MTRESWAVGLLLFLATALGPTHLYGEETSTMTLREVMQAIEASPSEEAAHSLYERLPSFSAESETDLIKAYGLAKRQSEAKGAAMERARQRMAFAASLIVKATAPRQQEWVGKLLEREVDQLPRDHLGLWGSQDRQNQLEQALRFGTAIALIESAKAGKNREALPPIRRVAEMGGMIGTLADHAISTIGDLEDLERAVAHIKANPEDNIALAGFGDLLVPRFMREIEDPNLPESLKREFVGRLSHVARMGDCKPFLPLLSHSRKDVRREAVECLRWCLSENDEMLILRLLQDPERDVRGAALGALNRLIWRADFVPLVIQILESDPDEEIRASAAHMLGERRAKTAIPALRKAAESENNDIRRLSKSALKKIEAAP